MSRSHIELTCEAFTAHFGRPPTAVAVAPARVELLGNHTDHNDGLVLAAAIDRVTVAAIRPQPDTDIAQVRSVNLDQSVEFRLGSESPGNAAGSWLAYVQGVTWALRQAHGPIPQGCAMLISGNIPLGAGLSSSASLQAAVALAMGGASLVADDPARMDLARLLRRAENEFVGVNSGLLDHVSTLFGQADHALTLDCRSLDLQRVPLGHPAPAIVVCDTMTSRKLADGMYNLRRDECQSVVTYFQKIDTSCHVESLRDVTPAMLATHWDHLDPLGRLRARHVLTENDRVLRGALALKLGDVAEFGRLMSASHRSSRDDFANSSEALDTLIASAQASPGFLGGKLSGAGWAGCTVNLVEANQTEAFAEQVAERYAQATGITPKIHICQATHGGAVLS